MAADGGSLDPQRPQFFKIIFPSPSPKLEIPRKFHTHLPSELPKTATLLCPHAEFWYVEICQDDGEVVFQKGWSEFTKAHDLCTGYFLLFQYNGNMNFEVKVFDTSCCVKDYSLKYCTRKDPSCIKIEASDDEDPALSDTSYGKTQHLFKDPNYKRPAYIEIEESSESEDPTISKNYHETSVNSVSEERKLSDSDDYEKETSERDIQMEVQSKVLNTNHETTNIAQFQKILTPAMVSCNMINIPRAFCMDNDLVANKTIFLKRKIEGKVVPKEWRVGFFFGPRENRIRKGWRIFSMENNLKIGDKCTFLLVSRDTFRVEIQDSFDSIGGKGKHVNDKVQGVFNEENRTTPQQHNVHRENMVGSSYKGPAYIEIEDLSESSDTIISGVSDGGTENPGNFFSKRRLLKSNIKEEEKEEQKQEQLDSQGKKNSKIDSNSTCFDEFEKILTRAMVESYKTMPPESLSTKREKKLSYQRASSLVIASVKKQVTSKWKVPRNNLQCKRIIKRYNLMHYMSLHKTFCMANGLNRDQTISLKKSIDGKAWIVRFHLRKSEGRLHAGWKCFARENELKEGDQCTFQLMPENTLHVNIIRKCQKKMLSLKNWKSGMQSNGSETSLMVRQFHLTYNYMSIPISFCLKNNLTSRRQISLKSPEGNVWRVKFYLNGSKEGRFSRAGWRRFAYENGLEVGDKCLLKLVAQDTMLVRVEKA